LLFFEPFCIPESKELLFEFHHAMDSIGYLRHEVNQVVKNGFAMPRVAAILIPLRRKEQANPKIQSLPPFASCKPFLNFIYLVKN